MPSIAFYDRQKIRLTTLGLVRSEMGRAYRAAVRRELDWQDLRAAVYALSVIARLDEGQMMEQRLCAIEEKLASIKPNGSADPELRP